jgi:hypothetical protein
MKLAGKKGQTCDTQLDFHWRKGPHQKGKLRPSSIRLLEQLPYSRVTFHNDFFLYSPD